MLHATKRALGYEISTQDFKVIKQSDVSYIKAENHLTKRYKHTLESYKKSPILNKCKVKIIYLLRQNR